ncbi:LysR family transcriptional regulator [Nesterenkonia sp. HG001]|uniref:LysR family transcriptional regulator n=1 Tax=Nesterenkonia sp. HG001 TaxID=2983207 RepID=UPI002AC48EB1|nr:LysR family transcriptional regulator [Nesterenkonia sp. HG001]MDZ5078877.1 LysR family transcriptional regulator [Nesterenkonia sp. HG001]
MSLDLTTLKTLRAVMEQGSFAAAGRDLGYTSSAVSQQMAGLERSLGLELFHREPRRIVPTGAAEYLYEHAAEVFRLIDQLQVDVERWSAGQEGRLRVGTYASAGGPIVAQAITRFLVRRRKVQISLDEGEPYELFPRVESGELDVALGFQYDLVPKQWSSAVELTEIGVEELHLIAPRHHRLASRDAVELAELRLERWVTHTKETAASDCLTSFCGKAGFTPDVTFRSNNMDTIRGIVAEGLGVALIPALAHVDRERTIALPLTEQLPRRQIMAATRLGQRTPLATSFLDAVAHAVDTSMPRSPRSSPQGP